jgi:Zn-dependent protease with chaperone function
MLTQCPSCKKRLRLPDDALGKSARCTACRHVFKVSEAAPSPLSQTNSPSVRAKDKDKPEPVVAKPAVKPRLDVKQPGSPAPPIPPDQNSAIRQPSNPQRLLTSRKDVIDSAFSGTFKRPRATAFYRVGLFLASLVSLSLPVLYVAFIAAIGWLIVLHLRYDTFLMNVENKRLVVVMTVVYLTPAIAGFIAILFMFKPLLAPMKSDGKPISLKRDAEPLLFEFIAKICQDVHAPFPKRIDIDCDVNASASFRSAWWSFFRGNDLVLTIGMPLVAGMSLTQFAGVLAHEFGHFSQGGGMRLTYILRSINVWFMRVIYERDAWDEILEEWARTLDWRVGAILQVVRAAIWFSRRVLWCLFQFGNLLTGFVQQQMEYDADQYEIAMAGKQVFASSFKTLRRLASGFEETLQTVGLTLEQKRRIENIPEFVRYKADKLSQETVKAIETELANAKTGIFDSHPSDRERIAAAEKAPDTSRCLSSEPASIVFLRYDEACRQVTLDFYEESLEIDPKPLVAVPLQKLTEEDSMVGELWEAVERVGKDCLSYYYPLPLPSYTITKPDSMASVTKIFKRASAILKRYEEPCRQTVALQKYTDEKAAGDRRRAGVRQFMKRVNEPSFEPEKPPEDIATYRRDMVAMRRFHLAAGARAYQAARLLLYSDLSKQIPHGATLRKQVVKMLPALEKLEGLLPQTIYLDELSRYLQNLVENFDESIPDPEKFYMTLMQTSAKIAFMLDEYRNRLGDVLYPFEHSNDQQSLADFLIGTRIDPSEIGAMLEQGSGLVSGYIQVRGRCVGTLFFVAEQIDTVLARTANAT